VKITKVEGITSLWSGLSPTLVSAVPTTVVYFTTYEQLKAYMVRHSTNAEKYAMAISTLSGGLARIWAVTLVSPLELVRTKMQAQKMSFIDVRKALVFTVKTDGISGLWKGLSATLLRDVPFSAVYWPCYEYLRPTEFNLGESFAAGAVAGSLASTVTLPMDVIKTRFQLELGERGVPKKNFEVVREILAAQGWRGLFSGLVPRLLKVAPACAIMISSYEYCKIFFYQHNHRD